MSAWEEEFARIAQRRPLSGPPGWQLAVVTKVDPQSVSIAGLPDDGTTTGTGSSGTGTVPFAEMAWARPTLPNQNVGGAPGRPSNVVSVGDVIVVEKVTAPSGGGANVKALSAQDLCAAPGAQCRGRRGDHGHPDRPRARHVGRLVLRPQPVQPRRPGGAPARLGLQALRLSRGHGCRPDARHHRARRAVQLLPGLRPAGVVAQELRRRLSRADDHRSAASNCRATS